jgi:hypothetical protein
MLFTQAAKLKPWFCSGDYRPFLALLFPCSLSLTPWTMHQRQKETAELSRNGYGRHITDCRIKHYCNNLSSIWCRPKQVNKIYSQPKEEYHRTIAREPSLDYPHCIVSNIARYHLGQRCRPTTKQIKQIRTHPKQSMQSTFDR